MSQVALEDYSCDYCRRDYDCGSCPSNADRIREWQRKYGNQTPNRDGYSTNVGGIGFMD